MVQVDERMEPKRVIDGKYEPPPAWHFAEEIARVERLIAENEAMGPYPGRERFLIHLKGRRDVLEGYMKAQKGAGGDAG